jgi:cell division protein FtsW
MTRLKTDWILFSAILVMTMFGVVMVYSASSGVAEMRYHVAPYYFVIRQIGFVLASFLVLMYFKRLDYRRLNTPAWAFSGLGIVLGLLVLVFFWDWKSHRWFKIAGVGSFQPSEFAKPALILFLAYFISRRTKLINDKRTIRQAIVAVAMLGLLVVVADLGTALVPVLTAIIMFWVAGLEKKYMLRVAAIGLVLCVIAVVSRGYRLGRFIAYFDRDYTLIETIDTHHWVRNYVDSSTQVRDPGYQSRQSKVAVGTGGGLGVGLTIGKAKLFVPDVHTDFIFAGIGEELGLWGATAVLGGYLIILWRGARLFVMAREDFGKYLALGVTLTIILQALFNMSVVLDMAPTKGFPLPMISFGGSSMLSTLASLGMLLSVGEHEG